MNTSDYKLIRVLIEGLCVLSCDMYTEQMWGECKCRKQHTCVITGDRINKGSCCFRPITNGYNRYHRISLRGMCWLKTLFNRK